MASSVRGLRGTPSGAEWDAPDGGVICMFMFRDGVGEEAAPESLVSAPPGVDWTWAHLRLGDVRAGALVHRLALPARAERLFSAYEERVQIDQDGEWVFGVLSDYERDLGGRPQGEGRLIFAFEDKRLVTGRLHALLAVDDLRIAVARGERLASPASAIRRLIELYAARAEAVMEEMGDELAKVEDYVLTAPSPQESSLTPLRRQIARRRREAQVLRSAVARSVAGRRGHRIEVLGEALVDVVAWLEDLDHEAAALQERGRLIHEEIDTRINAATNRSMRALAVISTLLIPPTVIVGAFGMNLPGIPWARSEHGFWLASGLCALAVVGALWVLRRWGVLS